MEVKLLREGEMEEWRECWKEKRTGKMAKMFRRKSAWKVEREREERKTNGSKAMEKRRE